MLLLLNGSIKSATNYSALRIVLSFTSAISTTVSLVADNVDTKISTDCFPTLISVSADSGKLISCKYSYNHGDDTDGKFWHQGQVLSLNERSGLGNTMQPNVGMSGTQ